VTIPPVPLTFEPIFKPKPWGGRQLETFLNKKLPPDVPIGESWELADLPGNESRVRGGPLAGCRLADVVGLWGSNLLGHAALDHERFPLLIKFLDASEPLSVQVHPKPRPDGPAEDVKYEAWYVVHAQPGAQLFIGLKDEVSPADLARAANTPQIVDLLRSWPAQPGQVYYVPAGTLHALGGGILVAEIQTPADVTYRLFDWGRVGLDGRPRDLHVSEALRNVRYDVTTAMVTPPAKRIATPLGPGERLIACERFVVDRFRLGSGRYQLAADGLMRVWIILRGSGQLQAARYACPLGFGDVLLIPAACEELQLYWVEDAEWLDVTIPRVSHHSSPPVNDKSS